jgi:hypothetical protein
VERAPIEVGTPAWFDAEIQRRRRKKAKELDPGAEFLAQNPRESAATTRYELWLEERRLE